MLKRQHRFHGQTSLTYVYRHGAAVRSQQLGLRYVRNDRRTDYRVAVIVGRKIHKSAVKRNRVRRRIYEIIRTGPAITEPYDMVITVFSDQIVVATPGQLQHLVTSLLRRANIYGKANPSPQSHGIVKARED